MRSTPMIAHPIGARAIVCLAAVLSAPLGTDLAGGTNRGWAAEAVTLSPATWEAYAPQGKEVDCIYGDLVLRNAKLTAVIARPVEGRRANMTVRNVGGCPIDLTRADKPSDQLSAYYPGGLRMAWREWDITVAEPSGALESTSADAAKVQSSRIQVTCRAAATGDLPAATVRYTLADGWDHILVETTYSNGGQEPIAVELLDDLRCDAPFEKAPTGEHSPYWVYDKWFGQAYGIVCTTHSLQATTEARNSTLRYPVEGQPKVMLEPGEAVVFTRQFFAGADVLTVKSLALAAAKLPARKVAVAVVEPDGDPVAEADVVVRQGEAVYGQGRTDEQGILAFVLPEGDFVAQASAVGRGDGAAALGEGETRLELDEPGYVAALIGDEEGGVIPCKVQFRGLEETPSPDFGPDSGEFGVRNVRYSEHGRFRQALAPGKYEAIVSHGPEFDAVFVQFDIAAGKTTPLNATLVRTVQTAGWLSADFHSHSSPSGDNTSSQLGRVLNLLAEHVEFAPCTEHNRFSSYEPHLARLNASRLLGTCVGIELTNNPGEVNHQNAFPFRRQPRTQDDGAPETDSDPEVQIERLALWDGNSDKLVQQNHPDIGYVFYDRNGDGVPDSGFRKSIEHMDAIEVHPPHTIFLPALYEAGGRKRNNTIVNWLQLLNQGVVVPGVCNTDAHYNFHGSGFLRIYVQSPTDDPAQAKTLDVVHAAEQGRIVMTSGPYMEVVLSVDAENNAGPGETIAAPGGAAELAVRVQCPNWFDIDRVQVLVNGRMTPDSNFTREKTPGRFAGGVVKFEQRIPLKLESDAHIVVVAAGEKSSLGPVMGPDHRKDMPIAVSNPIFVDVDGGGFKANGDTLDSPLPVRR